MPIGLTEEHDALRQAVRRFVDTRIPPAVTRAALDAEHDDRPEFWAALAEPGWLGLHVDESSGGAGYGYVEQAVVLEELGRAAAPGPYLPTVLAAAILQDAGGPAADEWLPQLATGAAIGAVALTGSEPVLGGMLADVIVAEVDGAWRALPISDVKVTECKSVDPTRRAARIDVAASAGRDEQRLAITDRTGARDRRGPARGRSGRHRAVVRRHRGRVREGPRAVRPPDRPVPRREASLRRHAGAHRAGARGRVGRGACRPRGGQRRERGDRRRGRARVGGRVPERQGLHPDARRHRVHVGARRAHLPAPGDDVAPARRVTRSVARDRGPCRDGRRPPLARCRPARRSRSDARPSCGRSSPRSSRSRPRNNAPDSSTPDTSHRRGRARGGATPARSNCS